MIKKRKVPFMPDIKSAIPLIWAVMLILLLTGCYPDESENMNDMELVSTECDVNYPFSSVQTYIMPDTVMHLTDPDHSDFVVTINTELDHQILREVADHFRELGYDRLVDTQEGLPDVYVTVSAVATPYIINNGDHWWYYWNYYPWWPGWNEGNYPWYTWGKPVYYDYPPGTLVIQILDVTGTDEARIPVIWSATINSLLASDGENVSQRMERDIDQAFLQSTYLKN